MSVNLFLVCDTCKVYKVMNNGPYPRIERDKNSHLLKKAAIENFLQWVCQMNKYFGEFSPGIKVKKINKLANFLKKHKEHKPRFGKISYFTPKIHFLHFLMLFLPQLTN